VAAAMDDLIKEFLQESSENLDRMDQGFVKLESDPDNPELVKSLSVRSIRSKARAVS
jgi:chemotaxis protein histidine kinase CheA